MRRILMVVAFMAIALHGYASDIPKATKLNSASVDIVRGSVEFVGPGNEIISLGRFSLDVVLFFPDMPGELFGTPMKRKIFVVEVLKNMTFTLDLREGRNKVDNHAVSLKSNRSSKGLKVDPPETRLSRIATFPHDARTRKALGGGGFIDPNSRESLILVYVDRPSHISGEVEFPGLAALFDIRFDAPGFHWIRFKSIGQGRYKLMSYPDDGPVNFSIHLREVSWETAMLLGWSAYQRGDYAKAEKQFERALKEARESGKRDPRLAESLHSLAELYKVQGRYAKAEPLFKRALGIREKALGPEHPAVATILNNMAELYRADGRYAEAEPLYKRSLAIWEKALGPEHSDVATGLNNLALLYQAQGRYAEAEPLYNRSYRIKEKTLGPAHPHVANSLNNLANLYHDQGRHAEAEPLYQRSLGIREKALGPAHPAVANNLNNLAWHYEALGKYAEAEPLYKRALSIREKTLGPDHPYVAATLENYAGLLRKTKRKKDAKKMEARAKAIRAGKTD